MTRELTIETFGIFESPIKAIWSKFHDKIFVLGSHVVYWFDPETLEIKPFYISEDFEFTDIDIYKNGRVALLLQSSVNSEIKILSSNLFSVVRRLVIENENLQLVKFTAEGLVVTVSQLDKELNKSSSSLSNSESSLSESNSEEIPNPENSFKIYLVDPDSSLSPGEGLIETTGQIIDVSVNEESGVVLAISQSGDVILIPTQASQNIPSEESEEPSSEMSSESSLEIIAFNPRIIGNIGGGVTSFSIGLKEVSVSDSIQKRARIFVGSKPWSNDRWDSGEISTKKSSILYGGGDNLIPGYNYWVHVSVWHEDSGWSSPQIRKFTMPYRYYEDYSSDSSSSLSSSSSSSSTQIRTTSSSQSSLSSSSQSSQSSRSSRSSSLSSPSSISSSFSSESSSLSSVSSVSSVSSTSSSSVSSTSSSSVSSTSSSSVSSTSSSSVSSTSSSSVSSPSSSSTPTSLSSMSSVSSTSSSSVSSPSSSSTPTSLSSSTSSSSVSSTSSSSVSSTSSSSVSSTSSQSYKIDEGEKIVARVGGELYISYDSGENWVHCNGSFGDEVRSIMMDQEDRRIAITRWVFSDNGVDYSYSLENEGHNNWISQRVDRPSPVLGAISSRKRHMDSMSDDGKVQIIGLDKVGVNTCSAKIIISSDHGNTWGGRIDLGNSELIRTAVSKLGDEIKVITSSYIYTAFDPTTEWSNEISWDEKPHNLQTYTFWPVCLTKDLKTIYAFVLLGPWKILKADLTQNIVEFVELLSFDHPETESMYDISADTSSIACSATGKYIVFGHREVAKFSSDYGKTWQDCVSDDELMNICNVACSGSGKVMALGGNRYENGTIEGEPGRLYISTNYGKDWNNIYSKFYPDLGPYFLEGVTDVLINSGLPIPAISSSSSSSSSPISSSSTSTSDFIHFDGDLTFPPNTNETTPYEVSGTQHVLLPADPYLDLDAATMHRPWMAFDHNRDTFALLRSEPQAAMSTLTFDFGEGNGKLINKYYFRSTVNSWVPDIWIPPSNWTIYGINSGSPRQQIHHVPVPYSPTGYYSFPNFNIYHKYEFCFPGNNIFIIAEIQLIFE